jgi:hypothetical protein
MILVSLSLRVEFLIRSTIQDLGDWNSIAPTLLEADAYSPPPSPGVAQDNVSAARR